MRFSNNIDVRGKQVNVKNHTSLALIVPNGYFRRLKINSRPFNRSFSCDFIKF